MPKRGLEDLPRLVADRLRFKSGRDRVFRFDGSQGAQVRWLGHPDCVRRRLLAARNHAACLRWVINLKTAQALGLTIQQSLLLRADEVIQ